MNVMQTAARPGWLSRASAFLPVVGVAVGLAMVAHGAAQPPAQTAPAHEASATPDKAAKTPADAPAPSSPEAARRARLVADTARLYKLAQELKVEVDKSSKDMMSVSVIKKAAELEALARDLKERMKTDAPKGK